MAYAERYSWTYNGKRVRGKRWYARWRGVDGKWHRKVGYTDKRATEEMARRLESAAARQAEGMPAEGEVSAPKSLADLKAAYLEHLTHRGRSPAYVAQCRQRITAVIAGIGAKRLSDLKATQIDRYLGSQISLSTSTKNHYRRAIKGLSRWAGQPLTGLRIEADESDLRRVRRVLSDADFRRLVEVTRAAPMPRNGKGFPGPTRAALYVAAAYTGFRAAELASITPDSIEGNVAHLKAEHAKNGKAAAQPVPPAVADLLRSCVNPPTQGGGLNRPLWPGRWALDRHGAEMLRGDLERAGIPYRDNRGRVYDFHSLRSQYVSSLIRAGVHPEECRRLARHADITTTMKHYARLEQTELRRAVDKLPPPPV